MVARPLVQGAQLMRTVAAAAAHTVALLAGSAAVAAALVLSARVAAHLPAHGLAVVCALAAVAVAARVPVPGSRWMVPREWARIGTVAYSAAFGLALGTGVMTLLPSAALYALLAAAQAAPAAWQAFALLLCFAAARAALVVFLTARSAGGRLHPVAGLDRLRDRMAGLDVAEIVLLAGLSVALLRF